MTDDAYRRYVREAIRAGLEDVKDGRMIEHEEVENGSRDGRMRMKTTHA